MEDERQEWECLMIKSNDRRRCSSSMKMKMKIKTRNVGEVSLLKTNEAPLIFACLSKTCAARVTIISP